MKKVLLFIVAIVVIIGGMLFSTYNSLAVMDESVNSHWAQIDNQLQRRNDLIPNLVNTVKGYASHEQAAIKAVTEARAKMAGAKTIPEKNAANSELTSALSRLMVVVENYPNLKADANFRALQDELTGTENRIAVARRDYNQQVQMFNSKIRTLPTSLFAGMLGYHSHEYFKVEESAKAVPKVQF